MARYVQPHVSQFDGGTYQGQACVPASLANGVAAQSGGARRPTASQVHALIPRDEEQNPGPGWSVVDADRAMRKLGVEFTPVNGWDMVEAAHDSGRYVTLAGDSDRFANSTCSGVFDGDHTIGVHPNQKTVDAVEVWWIDDPVCKTGRWERKSVIKAYAEKLASARGGSVVGGRFERVVPLTAEPAKPPTVVLRYGGKKLTPRQVKRIKVPSGRRANVRSRPDRIRPGDVTGNLANGRTFTAYQRTIGVAPPGSSSRSWYGDKAGTRWLHSTSF
jgi:hypothetical protein